MLTDRKALVTGGSGGIGRAIALALAKEGADVAITYFNHEKAAEETANAIAALGREARIIQANLAYSEEIDRLFDEIRQSFDMLDIFVSNAASATLKPLMELPARHWNHILDVNLTAFFLCSLQAVKMMAGRKGRIIGISSLGSRMYFPGYAALGVAKAGMETLAKYMAIEWAEKDVNVNVICGGPVDTKALEAFKSTGLDLSTLKKEFSERTPLKRLGLPQEIAGLVTFLCSPEADWIRGQTIIMDGGFSLM